MDIRKELNKLCILVKVSTEKWVFSFEKANSGNKEPIIVEDMFRFL